MTKKTIIYCVNIEHAKKTAEPFGDLARVVTSKSADNNEIIEAHKRGEFPVLINDINRILEKDKQSGTAATQDELLNRFRR